MTVTECSLMSCAWAHFLIDSHTMPGQPHSRPTPDFIGSRVYACLGVTCHLHFGRMTEVFWCHYSNMVKRAPNKSQHTKVNSTEENSPAAPAGVRTCNLSIMSLAFTNKLSWLPSRRIVLEKIKNVYFVKKNSDENWQDKGSEHQEYQYHSVIKKIFLTCWGSSLEEGADTFIKKWQRWYWHVSQRQPTSFVLHKSCITLMKNNANLGSHHGLYRPFVTKLQDFSEIKFMVFKGSWYIKNEQYLAKIPFAYNGIHLHLQTP